MSNHDEPPATEPATAIRLAFPECQACPQPEWAYQPVPGGPACCRWRPLPEAEAEAARLSAALTATDSARLARVLGCASRDAACHCLGKPALCFRAGLPALRTLEQCLACLDRS